MLRRRKGDIEGGAEEELKKRKGDIWAGFEVTA